MYRNSDWRRLLLTLAILTAGCGSDDGPSRPNLGGSATFTDAQGATMTATADSAVWDDNVLNGTQSLVGANGLWSATTGDNGYRGAGIAISFAGPDLASVLGKRDWTEIGVLNGGFCIQSLGTSQFYFSDSGGARLRLLSDSLLEVEFGVRLIRFERQAGITGPTPLRAHGRLVARRSGLNGAEGPFGC